jgi:plasmid rolling circle replication initiator protein Rep
MRRDSKVNPFEAKRIARQKYAERQIEKFVKWSWDIRGKVKYKELVELQNKYDIKCYAETKQK